MNKTILTYSGKVNCYIKKGNKIIKNYTSHNAGGASLFQFLCYCLGGDYNAAKAYQPTYIRLFDSAGNPLTGAILNNTAPVVENDGSEWKTTLHFRIPYSSLYSNTPIKILKLYSSATKASPSNYSAEFEIGEDWSKDFKDNTNLYIEWTMMINNENTTQQEETNTDNSSESNGGNE